MGQDPKPSGTKGTADAAAEAIAAQVREKRLDDAIACYRRKGEIETFMVTLRDLSEKEKEEFYEDVFLRVKGAPPKFNPFARGN